MAKKALVNKANKKPKFKVRGYTRCNRCGRPHAVLPQVRPVPNLLAGDGACRRTARCAEVQLVIGYQIQTLRPIRESVAVGPQGLNPGEPPRGR